MADTGAPWNIPYIEPTDLVRNYPVANELMADAIAAGLTAAGSPGIGSNVVSAAKTDTFTTTSGTFVLITGLSVTITPSSDTSKILIIAQISIAHGASGSVVDNDFGGFQVTRGATEIYRGDAAGTRIRAVFGGNEQDAGSGTFSHGIVFLDSPATGSAVTYEARARRGRSGSTAYINRSVGDLDSEATVRGASSITVIEVAA